MGKTFSVKGWRVSRRVSDHRCADPSTCLHAELVEVEIEAANPGAALDELDDRKPGWVWVSVTVDEVLSPARQMEIGGATPLFNLAEYE